MLIEKKLEEYKSMLDFNNDYFKKDFSNNFKFIKQAVKKFRKDSLEEKKIMQFIQDTIDIHKRIYS